MSVQLWAEKNYHWYLKQTISHTKANPILYVSWFSQASRDLMILSTKNSTVYTFNWAVSHSRGKQMSDKAVVSVVDGDKVLVTNFRDGVVPPPMAQQTLQFNRPINSICFAPSSNEDPETSSNDFLALLNNNKIALCKHVNVSHLFTCILFQIRNHHSLTFSLLYRNHGTHNTHIKKPTI